MQNWMKLGAVVLSCSVLGWGCSKEQEREPPAQTAPAAEAPAPANGKQATAGERAGSISGTVVYKGSWKPAAIAVSRDQENSYYSVTDNNGGFSLADIPPGKYVVELWHEKLGTQTQEVQIEPNGKSEVNFELAAPAT